MLQVVAATLGLFHVYEVYSKLTYLDGQVFW